MPLHGGPDLAEQRGDQRPRELGPLKRQLTAASYRLLQRMRLENVETVEVGGDIREKRVEPVPSGRRLECLHADQALVVVKVVIAGIAAQPPGRGLQGERVLVVGQCANQRRRDRLRLVGPARRKQRFAPGDALRRSIPRSPYGLLGQRDSAIGIAELGGQVRGLAEQIALAGRLRKARLDSRQGTLRIAGELEQRGADEVQPGFPGASRNARSRRASAMSALPVLIHTSCARSRCAST
jgi:hypothetical protein